jgi:hypothetical protein
MQGLKKFFTQAVEKVCMSDWNFPENEAVSVLLGSWAATRHTK